MTAMMGMSNHRAARVRTAVTATLLAAATLSLGACKKGDSEASAEAAAAAQPTVVGKESIAIAEQRRVEDGPPISGQLTAEKQATVRAQVSGAVLQTTVEQGQHVAAGALLARLDDAGIQQSYLSARSSMTTAQSAAELSARELQRAEKLLAAGAVAERDLEGARQSNAGAQAALSDARARLSLAEKQLGYTRVTAPFAGVVSERQVNAGDVVSPGTAMFTIVQPSSMRLEASVPAEQLSAVKVGDPVTFSVSGYGDRKFTGKITRVNPVADPATRQVRIYASIPNDGATLVGGLFAEGRVASESREGLVLPLTAVDQRGTAPFVMRLRNGRAEKVTVTLGLQDATTESVEIRSGLAAGDTVLVGAAQGISAGTAIRVGTVTDQRASTTGGAAVPAASGTTTR
jgi:RND family efflux transporter MFP subunit